LNEYCVHPEDRTKEITLQNTIQSLVNPESKEEMLSYYYGELDGVAVEEQTSSSIYNGKAETSLGLEEFYKNSTVSFQHLNEAIQSQNLIIKKLRGLASEIETSMKQMSKLVDDSNIKAKTIIRDVVSLKNGLPDAKRIDDDDDDDNLVSAVVDNLYSSSSILPTNESPDEIDRVQNKAEQLVHVSNNTFARSSYNVAHV
jgi:hypothetical protein